MDINPYAAPADYPKDALPTGPAGFRDQITGLRIFGILQILMGGFCALSVLGMGFALIMMSQTGGPSGTAVGVRTMVPALAIYVVLTAGLIWLGIGSIQARRWARALTLIFSWLGLIGGAITSGFMVFLVPQMRGSNPAFQKMPPLAFTLTMIVMGAIMLCIYVVLPLAFVLFYRRPSVRATCEWRNPQICWTDRCPLPVLALSVILACGAAFTPWSIASGSVMPVFGILLSGPPGALVLLLLTVILAGLAWGTYRQEPLAWWGMLALLIVGGVSSALSAIFLDPMEMYARMGIPAEQMQMMQKMGVARWGFGGFTIVVYEGVAVAYLFYVRRYFAGSAANRETPSPQSGEPG